MLSILVVEDEQPSSRELVHLLSECLGGNGCIQVAENGEEAINIASDVNFDVAYIDIHLGDMKGTSLAIILKKIQPQIKIVFATAYDRYAVKAFDIDAIDYILKPFDPKRVAMSLEKVSSGIDLEPYEEKNILEEYVFDSLPLAVDKMIVLIPIEEILYIESDGKICFVNTQKDVYKSTLPLHYFETKLERSSFFRTHKSFLVNLNYVCQLEPWFNGAFCLKIRGQQDKTLPVSRNQMKRLRTLLKL